MSILVYCDAFDGKFRKVALELLSEASKIAEQTGDEVHALVLGPGSKALAEETGKYGAKKAYYCEDAALENYSTEGYADVVEKAFDESEPKLFLIGHNPRGKDLAPRVAQRLELGMVSDVIEIEVDGDDFVFTKPIYAGKCITKQKCKTEPAFVSVRPNVMAVEEKGGDAPELVELKPEVSLDDIRAIVKELIVQKSERPELTEAEVIVSGGRGLGNPDGFKLIEELADVLGAAVGASRAVVDAGWKPHSFQVGQTGKVVSPVLYIACGISGAIQHLAGMGSSKFIVAINKDPEAPIFNLANYGIVGDLYKVLPVLIEELKKAM
jgi:electron transfer flavoprotein alpha subunit